MSMAGALAMASVVSSGLQGALQIKAGQQAARIGEFNARLAETQARQARFVGQYQAARTRQAGRLLVGQQQAAFAKAGVAQSGSVLDVTQSTEANFELDALLQEYNADLTAFNYQAEAAIMRYGAKLQARAGVLQGVTTMAGGVIQAGMFYERGQTRASGSTATNPFFLSSFFGGGRMVTSTSEGAVQYIPSQP